MKTVITVVLLCIVLTGAIRRPNKENLEQPYEISPEVLQYLAEEISPDMFNFGANNEAPANLENDPFSAIAYAAEFYLNPFSFVNGVAWVFSEVDLDNNGYLSKLEVDYGQTQFGLSQQEVDSYWAIAEEVGQIEEEGIPYDEFQDLADLAYHACLSQYVFDLIADSVDLNSTRGISISQMEGMFGMLASKFNSNYELPNNEVFVQDYQTADVNNDGDLNRQEFFYFCCLIMRQWRTQIEFAMWVDLVFQDNYIEEFWNFEENPPEECTVSVVDSSGSVIEKFHIPEGEKASEGLRSYGDHTLEPIVNPSSLPSYYPGIFTSYSTSNTMSLSSIPSSTYFAHSTEEDQ